MDKNVYTRQDWVKVAQLSKNVQRFQRMMQAIDEIIQMAHDQSNYLNEIQQDLLSICFKKKIDAFKISYRLICEAEKNKNIESKFVIQQKQNIYKQSTNFCHQTINFMDALILKNNIIQAQDNQAKLQAQTFYYKIKGDYFRYFLDFLSDKNKQQKINYIQKCKKAYECSNVLAQKLNAKNIVRLGLALNFSLYFYEIEQDPAVACQFAEKSIENAESSSNQASKKQQSLLQRLKDSVNLWTSNQQ